MGEGTLESGHEPGKPRWLGGTGPERRRAANQGFRLRLQEF